MTRIRLVFYLCLPLCHPAHSFEIDQFKSGMSRAQVKEFLGEWNFDNVEDAGSDVTLAFDGVKKETNRLFKFYFCNDRLVTFEQSLKGSVKNFVTVTQNYVRQYGQPTKLDAATNVISNGEKSSMSVYWRVRNDFVGLRYVNLPNGEDLSVSWEVSNNCFQAPRN
ncbi:MAG: hypothetical protein ABIW48_01050 [Burkholderiales bacterium]